ncbi:MAG TPA: hypothetical protein VNF47_14435 [Streptosporangiaceae bacterium]|nr:hypothetical protein [Streptosporangiaceae bacterium]
MSAPIFFRAARGVEFVLVGQGTRTGLAPGALTSPMCAVIDQSNVISTRFYRLLSTVHIVVIVVHALDHEKAIDTDYFIWVGITDSLDIVPKSRCDTDYHEEGDEDNYRQGGSTLDVGRYQVSEKDTSGNYGAEKEANSPDSCCRIPERSK